MLTVQEKMQAARTLVIEKYECLTMCAFAVKVRENPHIKTLQVNSAWLLEYSPKFVEALSVSQLAWVLLHEYWHLLKNHPHRMGDLHVNWDDPKERMMAKAAADFETNDHLRDVPFDTPSGGDAPIFPELFGLPTGLLMEEYLRLLKTDTAQQPKPGTQPGCGECGSCAEPERAGNGAGEASEDGLSELEKAVIRQATADEINKTTQQWNIPGNWLAWAQAYSPPKINWRKQLAAFARRGILTAGSDISDDSKIHKKFWSVRAGGVIMPALARRVPKVTVVLDSSGSMMGERIKVAQSEVFGVLRASGIQEVHYICADATVQVSKKIRLAQSIELKGGGGTDMALAMEEAAKTKCNLMIVLTDGETGWPEKPHGMDVMVVLCETGATAPSWAKSIHIGP